MHSLDIRKFDQSMVDKSVLLHEGIGYFDTYILENGEIFKKIKNREDVATEYRYEEFERFMSEIEDKLFESMHIDSEDLILPSSVVMDDDNVSGYTVPRISGVSLHLLLSTNGLEIIGDLMLELSRKVRKLHEYGIVLPDLGNSDNVMYDYATDSLRFIDYDGLQIGKYPSYDVSCLMHSEEPIFENRKYSDCCTALFTPEFDKATLHALFLYYTTYTYMACLNKRDGNKEKLPIHRYAKMLGIDGSLMHENLHTIFTTDPNDFPDEAIKRLVKDYELDKHHSGHPKFFPR